MIKKTIYTTIATLIMAFLLLTQLCGCVGQNNAAESSEPAESAATQIGTGRQNRSSRGCTGTTTGRTCTACSTS